MREKDTPRRYAELITGPPLIALAAITLMGAATNFPTTLYAQSAPMGWQTNLERGKDNTTVLPRTPSGTSAIPKSNAPSAANDDFARGTLNLSALLTADGQRIDRNIVWRIFQAPEGGGQTPQLVTTKRAANPSLGLPPGKYVINAAFGRAHLTRPIEIAAGQTITEDFVLNAGGLRLQTLASERPVEANSVTYRIYEGERNQTGDRNLVMDRAKPGLIIRLNAGIYHIVSHYGDANAKVFADITVEAGKLTEATISHSAARVAFKLVDQAGGEALPGTRWTIKTPEGRLVKRSVGALPSHVLAPGAYTVSARWSGQIYEQNFVVADGQMASVEVVRQE